MIEELTKLAFASSLVETTEGSTEDRYRGRGDRQLKTTFNNHKDSHHPTRHDFATYQPRLDQFQYSPLSIKKRSLSFYF